MDFLNSLKLKEYIVRNKTIIIYSFIIAIICYGYELFNFTLSIDEEAYSFLRASNIKNRISDGRFGIYFLNLFLSPESVLPYFPTLISIICIALTAILFINNEKGDLQSKIVFSTIFISFPQHSYYLAFNICNSLFTIGMVLTVISYLFTQKAIEEKRYRNVFLISSILSLTLTYSIYQGLIPIFILIVLVHLLLLLMDNQTHTFKEISRKILWFLFVFCSSFLLYKLIGIGLKLLFFGSVQTNTAYLDQFIAWGHLPVKQVIYNMIIATKGYVLGATFYGAFSLKSVLILIPFLLFVILKEVKNRLNKLVSLFVFSLFLISPFLVMYITGSSIPTRSMLALPFFLAVLWWLSYQYLSPLFKKVMLVFTFLIFITNTYHTTRLFYSSYVSWQADRDMANRIIERVYALDLPKGKNQIPIAFVGKHMHQQNNLFFKSDVFGASFFEWDNGNPERMKDFFKTIGVNNLEVVPKNQLNKYYGFLDTIPSWPQKGSINLVDSVVVVKLSKP
jgi:hypothetical protein